MNNPGGRSLFELEQAIRFWKKEFIKLETFEDGFIAELESHLRDEIDGLKDKGLSDEAAFDQAVSQIGRPETIGGEAWKTSARRWAAPPVPASTGFSTALFWNYAKTAIRKARRQKVHSAINVAGLAAGMACCLFLGLWIQDELRFDRFHKNADRIYRVQEFSVQDRQEYPLASTPAPLAPALKEDFPGIEKAVRLGETGFDVIAGNARFLERVFFADTEIFDVFDLPLLRGNPRTALRDTDAILVSESMGRKFFGRDDPVGRILELKEWGDFRIAGVFKDLPSQSHFHIGLLASFERYARRNFDQWGISNYYTYILAGPGFDPGAFAAGQDRFVRKTRGNATPPEIKFRYVLQPLTRIHLFSHAGNEIEANGDFGRLMIFAAVALFILLIACFNYVNFATAASDVRAKEIGLRKVVGAARKQIAGQFLGETLLVCFLAMGAAVILVSLLLPFFNALSQKSLRFADLWNGPLPAGLFLFMILTGLLAGSYPAAVFSAVRPMAALRRSGGPNLKPSAFRRVLVVIQFAVSIGFVIATLVMASQMGYVRDKNLGFDKELVINVPLRDEALLKGVEILKNDLRRAPEVIAASASSFRPGNPIFRQNYWKEGLGPNDFPAIAWMAVDPAFVETMGLQLAEGRSFDPDIPSDLGRAYLLNETAIKELGLASPIGKPFKIIEKGTVIGVVKDFHFDSLREKIEPLALLVYPPEFQFLSIRVRPGQIAGALSALKKSWTAIAPATPFTFTFLDEDINRLYEAERRLNRVFLAAATAAVLIACLGLFGLASLGVRRRIKEIGVRKVLGASTLQLTSLLFAEYLALVAAANALAWPAAWLAMKSWLRSFAYRAPLNPILFLAAALLAALIAGLTVSIQTIRAASANPVESLKHE